MIDCGVFTPKIKAFVEQIINGVQPVYDFKMDYQTLAIIDEIER